MLVKRLFWTLRIGTHRGSGYGWREVWAMSKDAVA